MPEASIAILGTYDPDLEAHVATRDAILEAERELGIVLNTRWITPEGLAEPADALEGVRAAIIAPRNPKAARELMPDILNGIHWLRRQGCPTLGIEAGFHHMVIELARNELGLSEASSSGYDPDCPTPVIHLLEGEEPSFEGLAAMQLEVELEAGSALAGFYAQGANVQETFRGHYVVNPDFAAEYERAGLCFSGRASLGERRFIAAMEWKALPFWVGVAYQPQLASGPERGHPVIRALVEAAVATD